MTRIEWMALARLFSARRREISGRWREGTGAYERQLIRAAQLAALDDTCRMLASWLKRRSSRFDEQRFLTLAECGAQY